MKPIRTERLVLRNWEERDRDLFHRINSDERVMEFFPFRRDRAASDAMMDRLAAKIAADGFGFAAAEIAATGKCIGFVGVTGMEGYEPAFADGTIEIGWRLAPEFWGEGYVTEASKTWLAFGFEKLGLDEIVSFAVWNNVRSTAVMERLGMRRDPSRDFNSPKVPNTHPKLKRHVVYALTRLDWAKRKAT